MAESLSIAASAAGLLSLGIQVAEGLIKYYDNFKSQNSEISRSLRELETLQSLLQEVDRFVCERPFSQNEAYIVRQVETSIDDCQEVISELQSELKKLKSGPHQNLTGHFAVAGRKALYPFRISTLSKLGGQVREIKENLSLGISLLQQRDQKTVLNQLTGQIKTLQLSRDSQLASELRSWLQVSDVSVDLNSHIARRHPGTGNWFTASADFQRWLQQNNACLWLHGFAGCGKSVLCSTAIEKTIRYSSSRLHHAVVYYYFTFSDRDRQNLSAILRATLLQLATQLDDGEQHLNKLKERYPDATPPNHVLMTLFEQFLGRFRNVYILIDAIDECPRGQARNELLDGINKLREHHLPGLHLLLASRPEQDISTYLSTVGPLSTINLNQTSDVNADIESFVKGELETHPRLQKHKRFRDQIQDALSGKAGENFRWAEYHLRILDQCPPNALRVTRCLETLPQTLDDTYARMLANISETFSDEARKILSILCAVGRPILLEELIDAIAVDVTTGVFDISARYENADDLNEICPGFLRFDTVNVFSDLYWTWFRHVPRCERLYTVRLAHFSIQEYLTSDRIKTSGAVTFYVNIRDDKDELAYLLLVYLSSENVMPSIMLDNPSKDKYEDVGNSEDYPLLHFAASHWFEYLDTTVNSDSRASLLALEMFNNIDCFYSWLQRLDDSGLHFKMLFKTNHSCQTLTVGQYSYLAADPFHLSTADPSQLIYNDPRQLSQSQLCFHRLYCASYLGLTSLCSRLLDQDSDDIMNQQLNFTDDTLRYPTCLSAASQGGHTETITHLICAGANMHAAQEMNEAANSCNIAALNGFLAAGIAPNRAFRGQTPLYCAAISGHLPAVEVLIGAGADVDARNADGSTAIDGAVSLRQTMVIRLLLSKGADISILALLRAVSNNFEEIGLILIAAGVDVNDRFPKRPTALQLSAKKGRVEFIHMLLNAGAEVDATDSRDATALHYATRYGNLVIAKLLLDAGARTDARSAHGTALQTAAYWGHADLCQYLIASGANVNAAAGSQGTALQCAMHKYHLSVANILLEAGANLNATGPYGDALQCLLEIRQKHVRKDHLEAMCELLLDRGLGAQDGRALNAMLVWAVSFIGSPTIVKSLLTAGADANVRVKSGCTILEHLIVQPQVKFDTEEMFAIFVERGTKLSQTMSLGDILHYAIVYSFPSIVRTVLLAGAGVNISSNSQEVPLKQAVYRCCFGGGENPSQMEVLHELITNGADVSIRTGLNGSALDIAIAACADAPSEWLHGDDVRSAISQGSFQHEIHECCEKVVELLLSAGAAVNIAGPHGTPLQLAASVGTSKVVELLINANADVNASAGPEGNALQCALCRIQSGRIGIVKQLLDAGADVNAPAGPYGTALQCAVVVSAYSNSTPELVKVLVDAGADMKSISRSDLLPYLDLFQMDTLLECINPGTGSDKGALVPWMEALKTLGDSIEAMVQHGGLVAFYNRLAAHAVSSSDQVSNHSDYIDVPLPDRVSYGTVDDDQAPEVANVWTSEWVEALEPIGMTQ